MKHCKEFEEEGPFKEADRWSVLPQIISETGQDDEPIEELTVCDRISGGADETNGMPRELSLLRVRKDGEEIRQEYIQKDIASVRKYFYESLKDDPGFMMGYVANIAMLIFDDQQGGETYSPLLTNHKPNDLTTVEGCNVIAEHLIELIFGDKRNYGQSD